MLILNDLRNVICTGLHVYDSKEKTWHTNVSVNSDVFESLKNREVIGIRDMYAIPPYIHRLHNNRLHKGIVISII